MSQTLPHLFSPIKLGDLEIRNRVLSTGHMTGMVSAGVPTSAFGDYHEARAAGGCGLIITESAAVHATSNAYNIQLTNPSVIDALGDAAERVKRHGCAIFGQLGHGGRETHSGTDGSRPPAFGPSAIATERFHVMPREMSKAMIGDIAGAFGASAEAYEKAGYQGLEIMASHGLLLAQFLNPDANMREDEYGGSRENRMRFLREVITSIRAAVGRRLVLGIRISADELNARGLETPEVLQICQDLDGDGTLDFFDICGGSMSGLGGSVHVVPPMNYEPGYLAPMSARIREAVSAAVFVAGRINDVRSAEAIVAQGHADMCGMTRAQICDPEMAGKAYADRLDDIRACIGCNQACIGHMQEGFAISCIQRPETGREARFGTRQAAVTPMKVLVAGGGPAGMKAAAVAAERGHQVILCEAGAELGGQVKLARQLPGRDEFGGLVTNLAAEMERYGVEVRLKAKLDRDVVEREQPDAVIIATGSVPHTPDHLLLDGGHVVHASKVLEGANVGTKVVIADWRCDWVGLGLAERLARDGCFVRLAVNGYMPGQSIQQYTRDRWIGDLHKLGVEITPFARLVGGDDTAAYFEHTTSGEPIVFEDVDTLVTATGTQTDLGLERALADWAGEVWIAGDAVAPRTCEEAVLEGLKVGAALGGGELAPADQPLRQKAAN
ncbi:MAG: FAD-dependent oxidoreductase [Rhizobiales bacterium]|nr:FAD-dependent oxidoreductase [Hyphomicrobiales bacterium]